MKIDIEKLEELNKKEHELCKELRQIRLQKEYLRIDSNKLLKPLIHNPDKFPAEKWGGHGVLDTPKIT